MVKIGKSETTRKNWTTKYPHESKQRQPYQPKTKSTEDGNTETFRDTPSHVAKNISCPVSK